MAYQVDGFMISFRESKEEKASAVHARRDLMASR